MAALDITVARAVVQLARRQCGARACGLGVVIAGSRGRPDRCSDCPLNDVDDVVDHPDPISSED